MPRTPIDYKKAVIYSIVSKTDETLLYIGSTTDFRKRKNKHKSDCNTETYLTPVYLMIRTNGGWDAFDMKPVKEFPCENKIQLVIEEERIRKEMNANLNSRKAYVTKEEEKESNKEYHHQYKEKRKELYEQNKDEINKKRKETDTLNREKLNDYAREYLQKNRDKINQQRRENRKESRLS